jgi:[ribosomal protein S5]-alanine N-acetyltransferase
MTSTLPETERLRLRPFTLDDAPLIVELLNDPAWLRFIGDRKVRSIEDARGYLENGPMKSYAQNGFGLWLVERKSDAMALGMCGLVKRDELPDVDIGFAFLEPFRGNGYAYEAASATLEYAHATLGFERVVAIASPDNERSGRLLAKLAFECEGDLPRKGGPVELWVYSVRRPGPPQ